MIQHCIQSNFPRMYFQKAHLSITRILYFAEICHTWPALPSHILVLNLSAPSTIQERLAGRQGHLGTGNVVILPAGAPTDWHVEREGEIRHLHLYLSPTLIQEIATQVIATG
jgi:hypothetical protein